ncbi:MAG: helix-turn-helix domain-containing protein [Clostridia bacterium]|nr:helix-turn-helix domain-containing protein [Clostridia bacterium]
MKSNILENLKQITPEEKDILDGKKTINRDIYMLGIDNTINSKKLLDEGKLITMRKHTRFIDFPKHSHDYVELIYMCQGSTTHIIEGKEIKLQEGELLFLGQGIHHSIKKADKNDIAVNFIILPHFFGDTLSVFGENESPIKTFFINCLCSNESNSYLHFNVSSIPEIQNLMENLILIVMGDTPNRRRQLQMTMSLIFMQIILHTDKLVTEINEDTVVFKLLDYIETNYINGNLSEAAQIFHYDISWLSREILKKTGKTFTKLMQEKRLSQAAFLLDNTKRSFMDISIAVGYENTSYFHKIFTAYYKMSPKEYRKRKK